MVRINIYQYTEGPVLDIPTIEGGVLKVSSTIRNTGQAEATNVTWQIGLSGGFLLLDGGNSGTIDSIAAGDDVNDVVGTNFWIW